MSTPRDLIKSTCVRCKELMLLNGELEDYLLFSLAKVASFSIGLGVGYWLWKVQ